MTNSRLSRELCPLALFLPLFLSLENLINRVAGVSNDNCKQKEREITPPMIYAVSTIRASREKEGLGPQHPCSRGWSSARSLARERERERDRDVRRTPIYTILAPIFLVPALVSLLRFLGKAFLIFHALQRPPLFTSLRVAPAMQMVSPLHRNWSRGASLPARFWRTRFGEAGDTRPRPPPASAMAEVVFERERASCYRASISASVCTNSSSSGAREGPRLFPANHDSLRNHRT